MVRVISAFDGSIRGRTVSDWGATGTMPMLSHSGDMMAPPTAMA